MSDPLHIKKITESTSIGWSTLPSSIGGVNLNRSEKERLVTKNLLSKMLSKKEVVIHYHTNGAPYLPNEDFQISISHNRFYLFILLTKRNKAGIDVQNCDPRLNKIKNYFLNKTELAHRHLSIDKLTIYWCVKEAILKLYHCNVSDFKNNITIQPFSLEEKGEINAVINNHLIRLNYFQIGDNKIVYASE